MDRTASRDAESMTHINTSDMKQWKKLIVVVTAALAVGTTIGYATADEASNLDWKPCGDEDKGRCAKLAVPIDHAEPEGETIDMAVAKLPAKNPEKRRGTLIFHAGGPLPSIPELIKFQDKFDDLTQWFDVVTFDSRGFGDSEPLCDFEQAPPSFPTLESEESYADQQEANAKFADTCIADNRELAEHADSEDVAYDIDLLRRALGEDKIAYYGNSYGTAFGLEYAEHYGEHLERLFLDSVLDHTVPYETNAVNAAPVADQPLAGFADACEHDPECALYGEDVLSVWDEVVTAAEAEPLPTSDGGTVLHFQIRNASFRKLTGDYGYQFFEALKQARDEGNGDGFAKIEWHGGTHAGRLTFCADFPVQPDDYESLLATAQETRDIAPRIGWFNVVNNAWRCAGWPTGGTNPPHPLEADDVPPALLVNGTLDQATPFAGAENVASQLQDSALLPVNGNDHAVYLNGNQCVRDVVHSYLLDGKLPGPEAECNIEE
jgi:pimeloyl-ACP methyl ester carboxylesterase